MWVGRFEYVVAPGRAAEREASWAKHAELVKSQPGFVSSVQLNSLGYPSKYVSLNRWESREAQRNVSNSEAFRSFLQANPAAATPARPDEAYEPVLEVVNEGRQEAFIILVDWTINPGRANADAFERSRKELFALRLKHTEGFVGGRLFQFLGNPSRYLAAQSYSSMDGLRAWQDAPEVQEFNRAHPINDFTNTTPIVERYAVVQQIRS